MMQYVPVFISPAMVWCRYRTPYTVVVVVVVEVVRSPRRPPPPPPTTAATTTTTTTTTAHKEEGQIFLYQIANYIYKYIWYMCACTSWHIHACDCMQQSAFDGPPASNKINFQMHAVYAYCCLKLVGLPFHPRLGWVDRHPPPEFLLHLAPWEHPRKAMINPSLPRLFEAPGVHP